VVNRPIGFSQESSNRRGQRERADGADGADGFLASIRSRRLHETYLPHAEVQYNQRITLMKPSKAPFCQVLVCAASRPVGEKILEAGPMTDGLGAWEELDAGELLDAAPIRLSRLSRSDSTCMKQLFKLH
jgi:hypothetical protein